VGLAPQSTVTDAEGRYEFTHVAAGAYTLEASADGFKTWSTTITLGAETGACQRRRPANQFRQSASGSSRRGRRNCHTECGDNRDSQHRAIGEPAPTDSEVYRGFVLDSRCRSDCHRQADVQGQAESQGMLVVDSAENVDPVSGSFSIPIPVDIIQSMTVTVCLKAPSTEVSREA